MKSGLRRGEHAPPRNHPLRRVGLWRRGHYAAVPPFSKSGEAMEHWEIGLMPPVEAVRKEIRPYMLSTRLDPFKIMTKKEV